MRQIRAEAIFMFANALGGTQGLFEGIKTGAESPAGPPFDASKIKLTKEWRRVLLTVQKKMGLDLCQGLDLPASAEMCKEVIRDLRQKKPYPITKIEAQSRELARRMEAELAAHVFLYVDRQTARFYANPFEKWNKTRAAYPGAMYDIEEGSKALAMGLNTASVFHMMRVLECGLKSIAAGLGITLNPQHRNWGGILSQIRDEIANRNKINNPQWKVDKPFFEQAYGSLHAVKDAWRNTTMHIEKVYDSDGAEHIYRMVRAFMEQLSTKLHE
jgi:hypothetical protein